MAIIGNASFKSWEEQANKTNNRDEVKIRADKITSSINVLPDKEKIIS